MLLMVVHVGSLRKSNGQGRGHVPKVHSGLESAGLWAHTRQKKASASLAPQEADESLRSSWIMSLLVTSLCAHAGGFCSPPSRFIPACRSGVRQTLQVRPFTPSVHSSPAAGKGSSVLKQPEQPHYRHCLLMRENEQDRCCSWP